MVVVVGFVVVVGVVVVVVGVVVVVEFVDVVVLGVRVNVPVTLSCSVELVLVSRV